MILYLSKSYILKDINNNESELKYGVNEKLFITDRKIKIYLYKYLI